MVGGEYDCNETLLGKISCITATILMVSAIITLAFTVFFNIGESDKMVGIASGLMTLAIMFSTVCMVGCRERERVKYIPY